MNNSENKLEHKILNDGTEYWSLNKFHQYDDLPAIISPHGIERYFKKGECLRKYGPTIKRPDGHEVWNTKEKYFWYRKDGASVIWNNGIRKYL